jgi:DNA-directed RNA polymerase subunit RPC12/RpoP
MRFRCATCGIEFENIEQLASHKRQHQAAAPMGSPGVTCLGCGKKIPLEPSQMNYSGPLTCPSCRRTLTVVIESGEVSVSRLG